MGTGQSKHKVTGQDKAILECALSFIPMDSILLTTPSLKLQRDKLKQYQKKIQFILDREHNVAKECLAAGQKDKALLALRRRKYQETLLSKTYGQLTTLEELVSCDCLPSASSAAYVFYAGLCHRVLSSRTVCPP